MEEQQPEKKDKFSAFQAISVMVVIGIVVAVLLNNCSLPDFSPSASTTPAPIPTPQVQTSAPAPSAEALASPATGWATIKNPGGLGFATEELLVRSAALISSGDKVAWQKHGLKCLDDGLAYPFTSGMSVYVEAGHYSDGVAVVRPKGESSSWFVPDSMVEQ